MAPAGRHICEREDAGAWRGIWRSRLCDLRVLRESFCRCVNPC
ncbi:hypothetical protein Ga0080574_TMP3033 [Salipiger abyssi]|uniref:Uncharacterized protein n=1 Tax=Salipiger abyssi TaxID=1250539 RepID=A0A1P8UVD9_9RHOB|nr:hypothetical protein Ga0080574_TMP3033 [Salipiger abyssi]